MTQAIYIRGDGGVFEVSYNDSTITLIIFYRGDSEIGDEVDFDTIPPNLRSRIVKKLRYSRRLDSFQKSTEAGRKAGEEPTKPCLSSQTNSPP